MFRIGQQLWSRHIRVVAGSAACILSLVYTWACRPGPPTGIIGGPLPKGFSDTRVESGDVLEIKVLGHDDIPNTYRVESDGTILFPYAHRVMVRGLTPPEIAERLAKKLSQGYLRDPQVLVFVKEYTSKRITIFGEVKKTGLFNYQDNLDIVAAITLAGGFTEMADRNATTITRVVNGRKHRIRVKVKDIGEGRIQNFMVRPGDVIFVPRRFF